MHFNLLPPRYSFRVIEPEINVEAIALEKYLSF
ncbi:hypothetical protein TUMEXPCC7403_00500 [Tumidithrix helvetica PCC 7403]